MTRLLEHCMKAIRSIKNDTYRLRNGIYQQDIKRINEKRRNRILENNSLSFTS